MGKDKKGKDKKGKDKKGKDSKKKDAKKSEDFEVSEKPNESEDFGVSEQSHEPESDAMMPEPGDDSGEYHDDRLGEQVSESLPATPTWDPPHSPSVPGH